jgi:hypothetical protein
MQKCVVVQDAHRGAAEDSTHVGRTGEIEHNGYGLRDQVVARIRGALECKDLEQVRKMCGAARDI